MGKNLKTVLLPIMIAVLMLASMFAILGEASGAEMPTETRAYGDSGKILYVYGDNKTLADEWREYLISKDYAVDLLPQDGISNAEYHNYNIIIVGTDADSITSQEALNMYRSDLPIIGIGGGGGRFAPLLGLTSHFYYAGSYTNGVSASNLFIYSTPNTVSGVPGNIQLYSTPGSEMYLLAKGERQFNNTLFLGNWSGNSDYTSIAQINNYLFYGYTISPKELTSEGNALLENILYYTNRNHGYNVYIPRMTSRITMDGKYSYLFEWYGANFIRLDSTWDNYTAIFEDESYIYLYLQVANTSESDYLSVHFENNNSRSASLKDSTFYVVLSEGANGVKYREAYSSGSWSSFKDPDGVNITAYWVFSSQYCTAEVRILKSYMGLNGNTDNLLGFGMQYTNITNYPSTFRFNEPDTYITAYSQSHWNGQYEEISTPASYVAPTVDGEYSSAEWNGASQYYLQDEYGRAVFIRSAEDGTYLYLGGYIANVSGQESTIMFYFDVNGNGGSAPQTDDVRFWGSKLSNDTTIYRESHGTGSGWSAGESPTNATMGMSMNGGYVYYELRIPLSVLGITSGTFRDVHMRVRSYIEGRGYEVPYGSDYRVPDDWTLLLTSPSAWGRDHMTFDAHNGTAVTLDGTMSAGEWNDAFYYSYSVWRSTKDLQMYMKTFDNKMYILVHYSNPAPSSNTIIELGFDVNYDHDGTPKGDDFVIGIYFSNSIKEWKFSGGNWVETTPSGWTFAADNSTNSWTIEIAIDYSKLNLTAGEEKDIGSMIYIRDYGVTSNGIPMGESVYDTSTWNRITSSDNWGESTAVPEFSNGIPAIMLVVIFVVVAIVARRR